MNLKWCKDVQFSLILPTRGRLELLNKCINSFISTASGTLRFEFVIIIDHDDLEMHKAMLFLANNNPNVSIIYISTERSVFMQRDYNNLGANASSGELLFIINDDVEMTTMNWDRIIYEKYLEVKTRDNIHMLSVLDDSHNGNSYGCCFPIFTKTYSNLFNGVFPSNILMWSADVHINTVFRSINRISYVNNVLVKHNSIHSKARGEDETHLHVQRISGMQPEYDMKYGCANIQKIIRYLRDYIKANSIGNHHE